MSQYDEQAYEAEMGNAGAAEAEMNATAEAEWQQREEEIVSPSDWDEIEKQSLAALNQFQKGLTKVDIKEMAANAVENLLINGNPLQIAEALSGMEMFVKEVKDDKRYKDYVREEAAKYPKGFVSKSGAKIECAEVGTTYDFSKCGDPKYLDFLTDVEDANTQLKIHQAFLKSIPLEGIEVLRDDEVVRIYPPSKSSTSSIKITLSKGF